MQTPINGYKGPGVLPPEICKNPNGIRCIFQHNVSTLKTAILTDLSLLDAVYFNLCVVLCVNVMHFLFP